MDLAQPTIGAAMSRGSGLGLCRIRPDAGTVAIQAILRRWQRTVTKDVTESADWITGICDRRDRLNHSTGPLSLLYGRELLTAPAAHATDVLPNKFLSHRIATLVAAHAGRSAEQVYAHANGGFAPCAVQLIRRRSRE
jgi:hypothetical protein